MVKQKQVSAPWFNQRFMLFVLNGDPVTVASQYRYEPMFNFLGILIVHHVQLVNQGHHKLGARVDRIAQLSS